MVGRAGASAVFKANGLVATLKNINIIARDLIGIAGAALADYGIGLKQHSTQHILADRARVDPTVPAISRKGAPLRRGFLR